ncbi:MAG TPA: zinc-dependent alcohol dehydrogenase [Candidatus Saccharimonadales bacterium]|jgi:threonine dehydrogenase-like Zn-dependent dehydrogenase
MNALCWTGINELEYQQVPDARIQNRQDMVIKMRYSSVCGSDLHQVSGYIPGMRNGDVIGHEFMGEVVEVGADVKKHKVGDRVVVCSIIACGRCQYCEKKLYSLCENGNTNPGITETMWGYHPGGIFGYSHAMGGFMGSHADFVRVPFADVIAFTIPDEVPDEAAVFASDSAPTGWMGADLGGVKPGDVVAVWGCGAVGQMAARAAMLLGADRVIGIDRYQFRLDQMRDIIGAEVINYEQTDVLSELRERSGGRGPDVCIEAVGLEAHSPGPQYRLDQLKQQTRLLQNDRPNALREAIIACGKGGTVFCLGVFVGLVDKFPMGALVNKGLTLKGAQQHGERYIPMLLDRMATGELPASHLMTHTMSLSDGAYGYDIFKNKQDDCVRTVFRP